jgi:AAA domain-containing protein
MEAVILCGVQGSGKTTLCRHRFLATHEHVSLDLLRSRSREAELVRACLRDRRRFVVDNTNPTPADRRRYIEPAREAGFKVIGYLVEANAGEAFARADIPPGRVAATARALQRPTLEEGFDELWHATAAPGGGWRIEPLLTTPPLF